MATQGIRPGVEASPLRAFRRARNGFDSARTERKLEGSTPLTESQLTRARTFATATARHLESEGIAVRQEDLDVYVEPRTGEGAPLLNRAAAAAWNRMGTRLALQTRTHLLLPTSLALYRPDSNLIDPGLDLDGVGRLPDSFTHEWGHARSAALQREGKFSPFHGQFVSLWSSHPELPSGYQRHVSADEVEQYTRSLSYISRRMLPSVVVEGYVKLAREDLARENRSLLGPLARAFADWNGAAAEKIRGGARYQTRVEKGRATVTVELGNGESICADLPARRGRLRSSRPRREDVAAAFARRARINAEIARRSDGLAKLLPEGTREEIRAAVRELRRYVARESRRYVEDSAPASRR